MLFSCVYVQAATFSDVDDEYINVIAGLGIMNGYDDGTFLPDTGMTRAEFAQLISNLFYEEPADGADWEKEYMGDSNENELITNVEEEKIIFSDVQSSHWAYNAIMNVYSLGYMNGISETEFDTESYITVEQVYKVLLTIMGYKPQAYLKGGYPQGYRRVANELKISSGVASAGEAKRGDVARIIYNCLDVKMQYQDSVGEKITYSTDGDTFLNDILDCYKIEGRMTDNGIISFTENSKSSESIIVSDTKIKITDKTEYLREYIGRDVCIYYKEDKNINEAVYGALTGKDEILEIKADDFLGFSNETVSYKKNNSVKKESVKNSNMIKNGEILTSYSEKDFKMNNGTISLIKMKGSGKYDLIIVDSYVSFLVDTVDLQNKKLYGKETLLSSKILDLSDENKTYLLYASDGTKADISYFSSGMLLSVAKSDNVVKIKASEKKINKFTVKTTSVKDNRTYIENGEEKYCLSKDFIELYSASKIEAGETYTLYLDIFGEVAKADKTTSLSMKTAFFRGMALDDDLDEEWQIKYFSEDGLMNVSAFGERVTIKDESDNEKVYKDFSAVKSKLESYKGLFRLNVNDKNEVTYIELAGKPKQKGQNESNRLVMFELQIGQKLGVPVESYYKLTQGFNGKSMIDAYTNTKVFQYDAENTDDDDLYSIQTRDVFFNDASYSVCCYGLNGDNKQTDYVLYTSGAEATITPSDTSVIAVVKSLSKGLDQKGDPTNVIEAYVDESVDVTTFYCDDEALDNIVDYKNEKGSPAYKLEIGDIIRWDKNSDGTLKRIYLMWDENMQNPHYAGTNQQGHLPGTIGYFDSEIDALKTGRTMPYAIQNGSSGIAPTFNSGANLWKTGHMRNYMAYPISVNSYQLTLTSQDITATSYDASDERYITETYSITKNVPVYTIENDDVKASLVPLSSLKTYDSYGEDCDRVFMITRVGQIIKNFYIRGYSSK